MSQDITAVDYFCGAGGSSTGIAAAGVRVVHAANHWKLAIDTHQVNHPATEHSLDDLTQAHPAWFPRTTMAWFSPECTNHSLAKGRKRKGINQLDLWGESGVDPAEERSRASMREVVEFSAYHRYEIVIVENVVDIRNWQHYDAWLTAMHNLGYQSRSLYLNAQFFGVAQSRDRVYVVFWKKGNRAPNLDFRPPAVCPKHGSIGAVQVWKKPDFPWGRYGARRQYVYRCPVCGAEVQPGTMPAAAVIDWSLPSQRIGDRDRPLKPKTIARIMAGLKKFGSWPQVADLAYTHAAHGGMVSATYAPLPTETTRQTQALIQPFITSQHDTHHGPDAVQDVGRPLPCVTMFNNEHSLVLPPFMVILKNPSASDGSYVMPPRQLDKPLTTLVASASQHALITPFIAELRNHVEARGTDAPLATVTAGGTHHGLVTPEDALPECGFRMLEPYELKRGMSFPETYIVLGSKRDQVRQIGNAVCCNVAQAIAERCVEALA